MWCQWDKRDALKEEEAEGGGVDGSRIELGEVWRGRWRERREKKKEGRGGKNGKREKPMRGEVQIKTVQRGDKKRREKQNLGT